MLAKYQGVFRSRWKALWWAAGICTTAYCTVPSPDGKADPATEAVVATVGSVLPVGATRQLSPEEEAAMRAVVGGDGGMQDAASALPGASPSAEPSHHVNPWALPGKG